MSASWVAHATFEVERRYPVAPTLAFAAWSDPAVKARWFGRAGWDEETYELDFRVGGRERRQGRAPDGSVHVFEARFQDIVAPERIIFSYDMHVDGRRISVSLVTVTLEPRGTGTQLTLVEQGASSTTSTTPRSDGAASRHSSTASRRCSTPSAAPWRVGAVDLARLVRPLHDPRHR